MEKRLHIRDINHLSKFSSENANTRYQIPRLNAENVIPTHIIDFSQALTSKDFEAGVHFYIDDEKFERIWNRPYRYFPILKRFSCVFSPDFSLYRDMPLAMKIWNIYRSRLLGQMMQREGIHVIPSVSWADKDTFSFCFAGLPHNTPVSISTVGILKSAKAYNFFENGCKKMCSILHPSKILLFGSLPKFDFEKIGYVTVFL